MHHFLPYLSISLSLDSRTRFWKDEPSECEAIPQLPSKEELQERVSEFKKTLTDYTRTTQFCVMNTLTANRELRR